MKKMILIAVMMVFIITLSACGGPSYTNISNDELRDMLNSDVNYYFIDVRTQEEYYNARIPGFTLNVDYYKLDSNHDMISELDRDRPVVVMCNSGNRSVSASKIFLDEGFNEVYNLEFGIEGWDGETE